MVSHFQLVRFDAEPSIDVEPVWAEAVYRSLEQVVIERRREVELFRAELFPARTQLFSGPHSVGKSLTAHWLARELERPRLTLDVLAVIISYLGKTGSNARNVLDYAKSAECVLFLDELDAVAKRRDDAAEVGELKRLVTVILQEIDDWPAAGVLIAATSQPNLLVPVVWRRFDVRVQFPMANPANLDKAIVLYLDDVPDCGLWQSGLTVLLRGASFSDAERPLLQSRRQAIVRWTPLPEVLERLVRDRTKSAFRQDRARVGILVMETGPSQRKVHGIAEVTRDTNLKATRCPRV